MSRLLSRPALGGSRVPMTVRHRLQSPGLAAMVASAAVLAACGGGSDDPGSGGASGTGTDDAYVASICGAYDDFADTFADMLSKRLEGNSQPKNQQEALKIYIEPFEKLVEGMEDANPPKDVKKYHDNMVKSLKSSLKKANDGDTNAFAALGSPSFPDLPADVRERLNDATRANKDCKDASFSFD